MMPATKTTNQPVIERIQRQVVTMGNGCELWTGRHNGGHPVFIAEGRNVSVARVVYTLSGYPNGYVQGNRRLARVCDNYSCVKALHIEPYGLRQQLALWAANTEFDVPPAGWWLYRGSLDDAGYGRLSRDGKSLQAHRWVYEALIGAIPQGLELHHLC